MKRWLRDWLGVSADRPLYVIQVEQLLTKEQAATIKANVERLLGDDVIVLSGGAKLIALPRRAA